ncbi:hypothetical protein HIM_09197 [Hirsutella minnesotensis 3608]|uniref:DNA 3'-5' helicase n=1 Tax=Hirsutella minnesotensis 3608 TaxID=1043627 RepID=A0A0F8A389_9HYPO|nr:hypothetical protein HIM_09197 [Hirsutella minnesotensis 3608]
MFRSRTTRKNIAYRVEIVGAQANRQEEEEDDKVCQIVARWCGRQEKGRVIVYAGSIERVERLGEALGCGHYHAKMKTAEGKATRFKRWMEGGELIVATNALGLGVDVPDVRLVVHAGMPRRLRDYVQESGRAGRDGARSQAVVVCRKPGRPGQDARGAERAKGGRRDQKEGGTWEGAVEEFVEGKWCRRQVLDRVMDGWLGRQGCEADEEACDICTRRHWESMVEELIIQEEEEEAGEGTVAKTIEMNFEAQRREGQYEIWRAGAEKMEAGREAEEFRDQLERWVRRCVVCHLTGQGEALHDMDACPMRDGPTWMATKSNTGFIEEGLFAKRRLADLSGCFWCGIPQSICERWEASDEDRGRFRIVGGGKCQYAGVLVKMFGGAYSKDVSAAKDTMEEMMAEDGLELEDEDRWFKWLGGKTS